jgi:hypothetical protein
MTSMHKGANMAEESRDDVTDVSRTAKLKALRAALDVGEASTVRSGDVLARVLAKLRSTPRS